MIARAQPIRVGRLHEKMAPLSATNILGLPAFFSTTLSSTSALFDIYKLYMTIIVVVHCGDSLQCLDAKCPERPVRRHLALDIVAMNHEQ